MKVGVWGISGRMGKEIASLANERDDLEISFGVNKKNKGYRNNDNLQEKSENIIITVDAVIDFSNASALDEILNYCVKTKTPLVLCSTGHTDADLLKMLQASKTIPILRSTNTSLGANYLFGFAENECFKFIKRNYQIDITETHHSNKKDIPSGTAIALANAILASGSDLSISYNLPKKPRQSNQIVVTSHRIGDIVGEHEIKIAGNGEIISIKHEVLNRKVFALGAIECAKFIIGKEPKIYSMADFLNLKNKCTKCSCVNNKKIIENNEKQYL